MPIPTRTQSVRTDPSSAVNNRQTSLRRPVSKQDKDLEASKTIAAPAFTGEISKPISSITRNRIASRPTPAASTRNQSIALAPKEAQSSSATSTSTVRIPTSSRASSTSSTTSHARPTSTSRSASTTTTNSKPKPQTKPTPASSTTQSRLAPPSTSSIKAPSTNTSRSRLTSSHTTAPSSIRTSRPTPTSSIQSPSAAPLSNVTTTTSTTASRPSPTLPINNNLQATLTLLDLLHTHSHAPLTQYKTSINTTLTNKLSHLQTQQSHLLTLEAASNTALNTTILADWLDPRLATAATQIQNLSSLTQDVDSLTDDTPLLAPLHSFETWLHDVLAIHESRKHSPLPSQDLTFVAPLSHTWHADIASLRRYLDTLQTRLAEFGEVDGDSGLGKLVGRQREFLRTLLGEVQVAVGIERDVVAGEREFERELLREAVGELGGERNGDGCGMGGVGQGGRGVWMLPGYS